MMSWHKRQLRFLTILAVGSFLGSSLACKKAHEEVATAAATQTGDDAALLESRESAYNSIFVHRTGKYVSLSFGHNRHLYGESVYNTTDDRELPELYTRFMTVALMYPNKIHSILEVGCGGGRIAWYLHRFLPDVEITTVELDPAVVDVSRKYFGLKDEPNFRLVTRDGRMFLSGSRNRYDVILIDAYRGPFVPFHLSTREFYEIVREHLAPGGVMAQNVESATMLYDSAVKTLSAVFPQTELYEVVADAAPTAGGTPLAGGDLATNIVAVAYEGQRRENADLLGMAEKRQLEYGLRYDLRKMLLHRFLLKPVGLSLDVVNEAGVATGGIDDNAKILTDDFAPVESLKAIARHNEKWTNQKQ